MINEGLARWYRNASPAQRERYVKAMSERSKRETRDSIEKIRISRERVRISKPIKKKEKLSKESKEAYEMFEAVGKGKRKIRGLEKYEVVEGKVIERTERPKHIIKRRGVHLPKIRLSAARFKKALGGF